MLQVSYEGSDNWILRFDDDILTDGPVILTTSQIQELLDQAPVFLGQKCKTPVLDKGCEVVEERIPQSKE